MIHFDSLWVFWSDTCLCLSHTKTSVQTSCIHQDRLQCQMGIRQRQPDMTYAVMCMHFKRTWWECCQQGYERLTDCLYCSSQYPKVFGWYFSLLAFLYLTEHVHTFQVKSTSNKLTSIVYYFWHSDICPWLVKWVLKCKNADWSEGRLRTST